jgi:hypothetical protein
MGKRRGGVGGELGAKRAKGTPETEVKVRKGKPQPQPPQPPPQQQQRQRRQQQPPAAAAQPAQDKEAKRAGAKSTGAEAVATEAKAAEAVAAEAKAAEAKVAEAKAAEAKAAEAKVAEAMAAEAKAAKAKAATASVGAKYVLTTKAVTPAATASSSTGPAVGQESDDGDGREQLNALLATASGVTDSDEESENGLGNGLDDLEDDEEEEEGQRQQQQREQQQREQQQQQREQQQQQQREQQKRQREREQQQREREQQQREQQQQQQQQPKQQLMQQLLPPGQPSLRRGPEAQVERPSSVDASAPLAVTKAAPAAPKTIPAVSSSSLEALKLPSVSAAASSAAASEQATSSTSSTSSSASSSSSSSSSHEAESVSKARAEEANMMERVKALRQLEACIDDSAVALSGKSSPRKLSAAEQMCVEWDRLRRTEAEARMEEAVRVSASKEVVLQVIIAELRTQLARVTEESSGSQSTVAELRAEVLALKAKNVTLAEKRLAVVEAAQAGKPLPRDANTEALQIKMRLLQARCEAYQDATKVTVVDVGESGETTYRVYNKAKQRVVRYTLTPVAGMGTIRFTPTHNTEHLPVSLREPLTLDERGLGVVQAQIQYAVFCMSKEELELDAPLSFKENDLASRNADSAARPASAAKTATATATASASEMATASKRAW